MLSSCRKGIKVQRVHIQSISTISGHEPCDVSSNTSNVRWPPRWLWGIERPTGRSSKTRTTKAIIGVHLFPRLEREEASRNLDPNSKRPRGGPHYLYYPTMRTADPTVGVTASIDIYNLQNNCFGLQLRNCFVSS